MEDEFKINGGQRDPLREGGRRKEDHLSVSFLTKIGLKYNWLITLFFAFLVMLGFGFKTPKSALDEIHTKINRNWVIDSLAFIELRKEDANSIAERAYIKSLLESSILAQCDALDRSSTKYLPCIRLRRERGYE